MSSRQINFFIAPDDLIDINKFLMANECLFIKDNTPDTKNIFSDSIIDNGKIFKIYLSKFGFSDGIEHKYLLEKNIYYVDVLRSNVIDFDLGGFYLNSKKELHRARFYYIYEY
jgi:hypothetical protein